MVAPVELKAHAPTSFGEARRTPGRHGYVVYFPAAIPRARCPVDVPGSCPPLFGFG
jgi:hypothetical protein